MAETQTPESHDSITIDLKNPALAALLAWLVPGLGHWYQGRRAKAVLFFVCVMGLFSWGVFLGGSSEHVPDGRGQLGYGRAVYFAWRPKDHHLAYLCQIGVGLPALPALVQAHRMINHNEVWWNGFMAPPRQTHVSPDEPNFQQPTLDELNYVLSRRFDLATFFTMVAGLLNLLAIFDAWAGPVAAEPAEEEEDEHAAGR